MKNYNNMDVYPLTVIRDRYNGVYSGGDYLAFNLDFDEMSPGIIGDDVECANFFYECAVVYGKGDTLMAAVADLCEKLKED